MNKRAINFFRSRDTKIKRSRNDHYSSRRIVLRSNPSEITLRRAHSRARARTRKIISRDDKGTKKSSYLQFTSRCLKSHSLHVTPRSTESLRKKRRDTKQSTRPGRRNGETGRENGNYAEPMIAKKREGPGKRVKGYISVSCYAMNVGAYDLTKRGEKEE